MKPVIGVTGQIGAGKSTVADRFRHWGAHVIDADKIGHQVLQESSVIRQLEQAFGPDILGQSGIDRRLLADRVFADPQARNRLESIVHPRMVERFREEMELARSDDKMSACVLDAAILFEAGWNDLCDRIIVVTAPRTTRLERIKSRGWSAEELDRREKAQADIKDKQRRADAVIENAGAPADCYEQVDCLFREWLS